MTFIIISVKTNNIVSKEHFALKRFKENVSSFFDVCRRLHKSLEKDEKALIDYLGELAELRSHSSHLKSYYDKLYGKGSGSKTSEILILSIL